MIVDDDAGTLSLVQAVFGRFDVSASMHVSARSGMARRAGVTLPVAAFTGRDTEQERSRVRLAGFDAYLTKPLHPLALLSAVAGLGERRVA